MLRPQEPSLSVDEPPNREGEKMDRKQIKVGTLSLIALLCLAGLALAFSEPPEVGKPAPGFTLKSNEGKSVSLKDYKGKWVVLYFYPKDFTSGCTIEAQNFKRDQAAYDKAHAVILGVSVDTAESHKSFCEKEGLSFKLLADTEMTVSEAYGSMMDRPGVKLSARNTFIIDPKGNIAKVFIGVKPMPHSEEVLAALAELQKK
jgi:thioredoxin-dependent peroxiredoxin